MATVPLLALALTPISHAQEGGQTIRGAQSDPSAAEQAGLSQGFETELDLPGDFHKYYGQRVNSFKDSERRIAKLDIDGDLNYNGTINNDDPGSNGAFEVTPPGLIVGEGEMTKIVIRLNPYRIDFTGEMVLTLEVAGVNRAVRSGQFDSFEQEVASTGRIRVWRDPSRRQLLLDSADPERRFVEFVADETHYPYNLPGVHPRTVYVEGVSAAPAAKGRNIGAENATFGRVAIAEGVYSGDLRLLATVAHREKGTDRESYAERRGRFITSFRTSFDHILFTVLETPQQKEFINNNAEGVWLKVE
jgi:hypothetical protein